MVMQVMQVLKPISLHISNFPLLLIPQVKCQSEMNCSVCSSAATAKVVAWVTVMQGKRV